MSPEPPVPSQPPAWPQPPVRPQLPVRPQPAEPTRGSPLAMALVLLLAIGLMAIFSGMLVAIFPIPILAPMLIVGGVFAMGALHYTLWGWWLGPLIRQQAEEEAARKKEEGIMDN